MMMSEEKASCQEFNCWLPRLEKKCALTPQTVVISMKKSVESEKLFIFDPYMKSGSDGRKILPTKPVMGITLESIL